MGRRGRCLAMGWLLATAVVGVVTEWLVFAHGEGFTMVRRGLALRVLGASVLATACSEGAEGKGTAGDASSSGVAGEESSSSTSIPGSSTSEGEGTTEGSSTSGTTVVAEGSGDDDPGFRFDLNVVDLPPLEGCQQGVDVVFVMDVSTTMAGFLTTLANEIEEVDDALIDLGLPAPPRYGLVVFVDDYLTINSGGPYSDVVDLRNDFDYWAAQTANNQQVNGGNANTTWPENSIDGLYGAADEFAWGPIDQTLRVIIHTTDDTFWNGPMVANGVMIQHGYTETVERLQSEQIRVFSFADDLGGPCNCEDVTPGWSTPYMGLTPIPAATDGGVFPIAHVLSGMISLSDGVIAAIENSRCDPYTPQG